MNQERNLFINKLVSAMCRITHPRYYESERGYQGALQVQLHTELAELEWEGAIIEQEYQKRIKEHNVNIRPDLIIHVPFDDGIHHSRDEDNFVVFELKLGVSLSKKKALADYESLANMCEALSYPYAVFIIINGDESFLNDYNGPHKDKIIVLKTKLSKDGVAVTTE